LSAPYLAGQSCCTGDVANDQNTTLIMPLPIELLRFFENAGGGAAKKPTVDAGIVVDGPIGAAANGQVATLGRGGSDLTATLLGRALGADEVSLWKDVPGLLTADPKVVPDARVIPTLHLREAAELAYYGAKVLHPRALIPVAERRIPIQVRPFAEPSVSGTEISARRTLERYPVKALSAIADEVS